MNDDLLALIVRLIEQVEINLDELSDEEAAEITAFLRDVMETAAEEERQAQAPPASMPEGTDLLWILSGGDPNTFVSYLRSYPGVGFKELAANPAQLSSIISSLQRHNPIAPAQVAPDGIPNSQLHSSNVVGMRYDPMSRRLLVKFWGNGKQDPIYQYRGVPPQIAKLLEHGNAFAKTDGRNARGAWWKNKNPSLGAAVNQYLKAGGFDYQRLR